MRMSDWSADVCSSDLLDPAIGLGVRHVRETGDVALVGGLSMPLPIFDRNPGNVAAARANIRAAEAGLVSARASATVRAGNAIVRSEELRVGNECVRTCSSRRSTYHSTKTMTQQ